MSFCRLCLELILSLCRLCLELNMVPCRLCLELIRGYLTCRAYENVRSLALFCCKPDEVLAPCLEPGVHPCQDSCRSCSAVLTPLYHFQFCFRWGWEIVVWRFRNSSPLPFASRVPGHATLCHTIPHHVRYCHTMLRHARYCHTMLRHASSSHPTSWPSFLCASCCASPRYAPPFSYILQMGTHFQ